MKRPSATLLKTLCGLLLVSLGTLLAISDPLRYLFQYMMRIEEPSLMFNSFQHQAYVVHQTVYVFNYTNTERYLKGLDDKLKVEEIGPFVFREVSEGLNMSLDNEEKVLRMTVNASLVFVPELSIANTTDVVVVVPNLVMIVLGTLAADLMPSWSNSLAAMIMRTANSKLFNMLTVEELLFGYPDPLIDLAGTFFPGWIDFSSVGIMSLFYGAKLREVEMETEGESMYAIRNWNGLPGLLEQSYDGSGTENLCNYVRGSYQGIMLSPEYPTDQVVNLFKYQGCRVYQFSYDSSGINDYGIQYNRFSQKNEIYNASSEYACTCGTVCPPDGLTDISRCFYGFPAYLSAPHFYNAAPWLLKNFEGFTPEREKAKSIYEVEPITGVPLYFQSSQQTNLRIHVTPFNPLTSPLNNISYIPVLYFTLSTPYGPPDDVRLKLKLRYVYGPPLLIVLEVTLIAVGLYVFINTLKKVTNYEKRERTLALESEVISELLYNNKHL